MHGAHAVLDPHLFLPAGAAVAHADGFAQHGGSEDVGHGVGDDLLPGYNRGEAPERLKVLPNMAVFGCFWPVFSMFWLLRAWIQPFFYMQMMALCSVSPCVWSQLQVHVGLQAVHDHLGRIGHGLTIGAGGGNAEDILP